jgi:hypothetical protein
MSACDCSLVFRLKKAGAMASAFSKILRSGVSHDVADGPMMRLTTVAAIPASTEQTQKVVSVLLQP